MAKTLMPMCSNIVYDTLNFDIPLVPVHDSIYSLELFHGPTLAFKDVGARFMARLLGYFIQREGGKDVNVLVATSGDTGSAVANGFLGVPGIQVYVLYPKGKVSEIQEKQFTTLGRNITALEIDGTFDDCQALVKSAFMDKDLNKMMHLTSANSINVARFLPQAFYYFYAYAQLLRRGISENVVICVPSGNFGNITAGLFAKRMGLPVKRFIAANNRNDIFLHYLRTGEYEPKPSVATLANAMDVGAPSNFARVLDLYGGSHDAICADISGAAYTDGQIRETLADVYRRHHYLLDPHGTCGYRALSEGCLSRNRPPGQVPGYGRGDYRRTGCRSRHAATVYAGQETHGRAVVRLYPLQTLSLGEIIIPADIKTPKANRFRDLPSVSLLVSSLSIRDDGLLRGNPSSPAIPG